MLITHDLGVVAGMTERIQVMYAGRIVETATTVELFAHPRHPYTVGLLRSIPRLDETRGLTSSSRSRACRPTSPACRGGCPFAPRCAWAIERCLTDDPALAPVEPGRRGSSRRDRTPPTGSPAGTRRPTRRPGPASRRAARISGRLARPADRGERPPPAAALHGETPVTAGSAGRSPAPASEAALAGPGRATGSSSRSRDLRMYFPITEGLILERHVGDVRAVDDVSFDIRAGETLGLVGESGCGKSTTGRTIIRLYKPTAGTIIFDGIDITRLEGETLRKMRRRMQMIFQDPYASLNPRMTVGGIVGEPLAVHDIGTKAERHERVAELLDVVGLNPNFLNRYPHEFSGGQRQRIGVARALAVNPELIVADEPISALDVSIQAQIINLLERLQDQFELTYLFIAHDLSVVRHVSDRIAVMYLGRIVEIRAVARSSTRGRSTRTRWPSCRRSRSPIRSSSGRRRRIILTGDVPSPVEPAVGLPVPHPLLAPRAARQPRSLRDRGPAASAPSRPGTRSPATSPRRSTAPRSSARRSACRC